MPNVRIKASPLGKRAGLLHSANEHASFTVLVLPKPWTHESRTVGSDLHLVVVMRECEEVVVEVDEELDKLLLKVQQDIDDGVAEATAFARKARKAGGRGVQSQQAPLPTEVLYDEEDADDGDTAESTLNQLVHVGRTKAAPTPTKHPNNADDRHQWIAEHLLSLIRLAARASSEDRWQHRSVPDLDADGAQADASDEPKPEDPLRLITQWTFVEQVEARMQRIRRGYVPIEETAPVIRGRITQRGLVQAASGSTPNIECAHDEFTDTTPLFRVLMSALDHVASGALAEHLGVGGWSVIRCVQDKAVHLRRQLAPIPSLPLPMAAEQARRLTLRPLPRMLREWQDALDLARSLLRDEGTTFRGATAGGSCQHWWFDTSKLWEGIVEQVLKDAFGEEQVQAQGVQTS